MPRPLEYGKLITVRVTEQDHAQLAQLAAASECFMSDIVRELVLARLREED